MPAAQHQPRLIPAVPDADSLQTPSLARPRLAPAAPVKSSSTLASFRQTATDASEASPAHRGRARGGARVTKLASFSSPAAYPIPACPHPNVQIEISTSNPLTVFPSTNFAKIKNPRNPTNPTKSTPPRPIRPIINPTACSAPSFPRTNLPTPLQSRDGRLLYLTLNRPDKRNALDADLCRALVDALDHANQDPSVGAILLTANGPAFCAGMDLTEIEHSPDTDEIGRLHEQLFTIGTRLTRPLIAAVHGPALGGGTGLVANAHIVVAAPDATFGLTEIRLGLWPFLVYRAVEAALGPRRTLELSLTGRLFSAPEARDCALVHEIADNPTDRARDIALGLAAASPTAVQTGLQFVHRSAPLPSDQAGALAQQMRNHVFSGDDFREGLRAFREKRPPQWPSIRQEHRE